MLIIDSVHVIVVIECDICGYQFDHMDYDAVTVDGCGEDALSEHDKCPNCHDKGLGEVKEGGFY